MFLFLLCGGYVTGNKKEKHKLVQVVLKAFVEPTASITTAGTWIHSVLRGKEHLYRLKSRMLASPDL